MLRLFVLLDYLHKDTDESIKTSKHHRRLAEQYTRTNLLVTYTKRRGCRQFYTRTQHTLGVGANTLTAEITYTRLCIAHGLKKDNRNTRYH